MISVLFRLTASQLSLVHPEGGWRLLSRQMWPGSVAWQGTQVLRRVGPAGWAGHWADEVKDESRPAAWLPEYCLRTLDSPGKRWQDCLLQEETQGPRTLTDRDVRGPPMARLGPHLTQQSELTPSHDTHPETSELLSPPFFPSFI